MLNFAGDALCEVFTEGTKKKFCIQQHKYNKKTSEEARMHELF